jgi:2-hydroxychromene-2-carboxylate isomerase
VQSVWKSNFEMAKAAGVFGISTFRYEGEIYCGQDGPLFLERHLNGEKLTD